MSGAQGTVLEHSAIECDEKPCESRADEIEKGAGIEVETSLMLKVIDEAAAWIGKARNAMRLVPVARLVKFVPLVVSLAFMW